MLARLPPPTEPPLPALQVSAARASLLSWYDRSHRVLPWRRTPHSLRSKEERAALGVEAEEGLDEDTFAYRE